VKAQTREWHEDRRGGIGSSDAPIITGDAPWGDLLTLYAVKAGLIDEPGIDTSATRWGLRLEDVVAEWVMETSGRKVRRVNRRLRHKTLPWMRASLDREYVGERRLLEIKTRRYPTDEWGPAGSSEIPAHYLVQVQHQLAVTGYGAADVAVLFAGSDPRLYHVERDEALIAALIELETEFWQAVVDGTPPEPLIRRQIAPLIPFRDGEITADATLALGIEGVHGLRAEIRQRKTELGEAEGSVKTLLGPHTAARAGAYRATYKPSKEAIHVRWELVAGAYRKAIEQARGDVVLRDLDELDLDAIESVFTVTRPGNRPLLITLKEEAVNAA
jgi:putative phage-type endonuclease